MTLPSVIRALSSHRRLQILKWLKDPRAHFQDQRDGDLVKDGVCGLLLAEKMKVTAPAVTRHMRVLLRVGLVEARRVKQWTFYKRDERRIRGMKRLFQRQV